MVPNTLNIDQCTVAHPSLDLEAHVQLGELAVEVQVVDSVCPAHVIFDSVLVPLRSRAAPVAIH